MDAIWPFEKSSDSIQKLFSEQCCMNNCAVPSIKLLNICGRLMSLYLSYQCTSTNRKCIQPNIQNVGGPFLHLISNIGERVPLLLSLYAALTGTWLCMMERSGHRHRAGNTRASGRVSEWLCDKGRDLSANGYLHKILVSRWNNKSPHICLNLLYYNQNMLVSF